jgi:hypothetical protein
VKYTASTKSDSFLLAVASTATNSLDELAALFS